MNAKELKGRVVKDALNDPETPRVKGIFGCSETEGKPSKEDRIRALEAQIAELSASTETTAEDIQASYDAKELADSECAERFIQFGLNSFFDFIEICRKADRTGPYEVNRHEKRDDEGNVTVDVTSTRVTKAYDPSTGKELAEWFSTTVKEGFALYREEKKKNSIWRRVLRAVRG